MKLDLIYAESREELDEKIEAKLTEGWHPVSEIVTVRPPNIDDSIPHFVYYVQVVTNEK